MKSLLKSRAGSALVGVLALSVIMSISALGYSGVTRNTVNHEIDALNEAKALLAAEAGLLMGTNWLKDAQNWDHTVSTSGIVDLLSNVSEEQKTIYPDFSINVDLVVSNDSIQIISTSTTDELPYTKQLSWTVVKKNITSGAYGYFVNDAYTATGNFAGLRAETFDGAFHSNMPLWLFNPTTGNENSNKVTFKGPVTVYNRAPRDFHGNYGIGRNDYNSGVKSEKAYTPEQLDQVFLNSYNSNGPKLEVEYNSQGMEIHPLSASGDNTLTFGVESGQAYYSYAGTKISYDPKKQVIIHAKDFDLTVRDGTMKGNVTVVTDPGKNITVDLNQGSLKYDGVHLTTNDGANNYGVDTDDVLAFYSGNNIDLLVAKQGGPKTPVLTAQLFACGANGTIKASGVNKSEFTIIGSIVIDKWWDPPHGVNEPTVRVLHDKRKKAAPGLRIVELNEDNSAANSIVKTNWTETNIPRS